MLTLFVIASMQHNSLFFTQSEVKPLITLEFLDAQRKQRDEDTQRIDQEFQEIIAGGKQLDAIMEHVRFILEQKRREAAKPAAPR